MTEQNERNIHLLLNVAFPQPLVDRIKAVASDVKLHVSQAKDASSIQEDLLNQAEVLYTVSTLPDPDQVPNLRWVQMHYSGLDHIQGHPLLSADVVFTTMSGASAPQMAEFAVMSLLAQGHRLPEILRSTPAQQWADGRFNRFQPVELRGSTVGIVGYGSIGREIGRLCKQFGANLLAVKLNLKELDDPGYLVEGLGDPKADLPDRIYPPEALRTMVPLCDFLVICVPLTPKTQGIINAEIFKAMKSTAFLVDISRGGIVDHGALVDALNGGVLAGAALDVYPVEPLPESSPLWEMPQVILSPHLAGASPHYLDRAVELFCENLRRYLSNQPLLNIFDPQRGY